MIRLREKALLEHLMSGDEVDSDEISHHGSEIQPEENKAAEEVKEKESKSKFAIDLSCLKKENEEPAINEDHESLFKATYEKPQEY